MYRRLLTLVFLHLLLPSLLCRNDNNRCFFYPIMAIREDEHEFMATECPKEEVCYKAVGRFGKFEALSGRGCVPRTECGRVTPYMFRAVEYMLSINCCEGSYCNSCPRLTGGTFSLSLALLTLSFFSV